VDQKTWYAKRAEILERRETLAPKLALLSERIRAFFAEFPADPLTSEPVFPVRFETSDDHPGGLVTVESSMLGATLTFALPAEALDIQVSPKPRNTTGALYEVQPESPGDPRTFVLLRTPHGGGEQQELRPILRAFADSAFANADRRRPPPKLI
jgi:hypothetical protein